MIRSYTGSGRGDAEMTKGSDGGHRLFHGRVGVWHAHLCHWVSTLDGAWYKNYTHCWGFCRSFMDTAHFAPFLKLWLLFSQTKLLCLVKDTLVIPSSGSCFSQFGKYMKKNVWHMYQLNVWKSNLFFISFFPKKYSYTISIFRGISVLFCFSLNLFQKLKNLIPSSYFQLTGFIYNDLFYMAAFFGARCLKHIG